MNKEILLKVFTRILGNQPFDSTCIQQYFAPDYSQTVNGHTLSYQQFVKHLEKLKADVVNMDTEIQSMAAEGDRIFTHHLVTTEMTDGSLVRTKVMAEFIFRENKIIACHELTHQLSGSMGHHDLGFRR